MAQDHTITVPAHEPHGLTAEFFAVMMSALSSSCECETCKKLRELTAKLMASVQQ